MFTLDMFISEVRQLLYVQNINNDQNFKLPLEADF